MGVEISALPTATLPYDGTEVMPIVQAGETRKATLLPYKVYTALLTQTGTNAPVATVLENTLGGTVVWSYSDVGIYFAGLTGAFTANKTFILYSFANDGNGRILNCFRQDADLIGIFTLSDSSTLANGMLVYQTSFEIRVYPT